MGTRMIAAALARAQRLLSDEQGTETLEWGLICGLIVVGTITALAIIGPKVSTMWNNMNSLVP